MFFAKNRNLEKYVDTLFPVTVACLNDSHPSKINGTIGSLYDEDNKIVAYKSVFDSLRSLDNGIIAKYSSGSFGNNDFNETIVKFVLEDRVNNYRNLPTPGGTGAIALGINVCLDSGDTIVIPDIAWGNYKNIAIENNLKVRTYNPYEVEKILDIVKDLDKICIVINSPCQNPCGLSYSYEEWKKLLDSLKSLNKEVIIVNDVAYIDYSSSDNYKDYFSLFNDLSDNMLVFIAYSCSKTFSYYGLRVGALFMIHNNDEFLDLLLNQCARRARAVFSSVNNAGMTSIADVINNHLEEFNKEKAYYVDLIKKRADIFVNECKENDIDIYPYNDGFFVTLKYEDNKRRDEVFKKFVDDHIYFIKVNKGIRVGICSIPLEKIQGLAKRLKTLL